MGVIVVGFVPKPEGHAALQRGIEEARLRDASLVVVSSHRSRDMSTPEQNASVEAEVTEVEQQLQSSGIPFEVRQTVRGLEPAEDLIAVSDEVGAELIVIGLRRRTPIGKLILGSNAQQVLLDAAAPVLAVKA